MIRIILTVAVAASAALCMVYAALCGPSVSDQLAPPPGLEIVDADGDGIRELDTIGGRWIVEDGPLWNCAMHGNLTCDDTYYGN